MLTPQHQLESLSLSYVTAVAGRAGLTCSVRDPDYGIDLTVHEITVRTNPGTGKKRFVESGASLDIQIKSTTRATVESKFIVHDLESEAYDDLCNPNVRTPRILVLYVAPADEMSFNQDEERLAIGGCSYWMSFKGCKPTSNLRQQRVRIPHTNVFREEVLREMMRRVREGGDP